MPKLERLAIEHSCIRLMAVYCNAVDDWDLDAVVALFARDGVLIRPDVGTLRGRDAIRQFFQALPTIPRRHVMSNAVVSVVDGKRASGRSYMTAYSAPKTNSKGIARLTAPYLIAEYHDLFILEDGEWRFASRDTIFKFREDA